MIAAFFSVMVLFSSSLRPQQSPSSSSSFSKEESYIAIKLENRNLTKENRALQQRATTAEDLVKVNGPELAQIRQLRAEKNEEVEKRRKAEGDVEVLQGQLDDTRKRAHAAETAKREKNHQIDTLRNQMWTAVAEKAQLAHHLDRKEQQCVHLGAQANTDVSQKDQQLAELNAQTTAAVGQKDQQLAELNVQATAAVRLKDQQLAELNERATAAVRLKDQQLQALAAAVAQKDREIANLQQQLQQSSRRVQQTPPRQGIFAAHTQAQAVPVQRQLFAGNSRVEAEAGGVSPRVHVGEHTRANGSVVRAHTRAWPSPSGSAREVFTGPRGGRYYLTPGGNKVYI